MGSRFISRTIESTNVNAGYDFIREEDARRFGEDYYSGAFGSTNLGRVKTLTDGMHTKDILKKANSIIDEEMENGSNWGNVVKGLDLGIVGYDIVTIKKESNKAKSPVYETYYIVYSSYSDSAKKLFKSKVKKEAEEKLISYGFDYPNAILIKEPILVSGSSIVTSLNRTVKRVTKKPTKIPAKAKVIPIHKYIFYGWVSE